MARISAVLAGAALSLAVTGPASGETILPANTLVVITPADDVDSRKVREGDSVLFLVVNEISEKGQLIIPRGAPVRGDVTWRTGKGIVGKSAKFEVSFRSVNVAGRDWQLRGKHRQEGRGNTAGALLGSMIITGRSAVMPVGMLVNVFTAEPITVP